MKKVVLLLMMCLSGLLASAETYNVTIDDFDFDCSSDNDIDISSQIGELLKIGDEVNVTVEGYFSAKVTGVGICGIVDGMSTSIQIDVIKIYGCPVSDTHSYV